MTALSAIALLIVAALAHPKLHSNDAAPATPKPRTITEDTIFARVAAKLREANVVVEFPQHAAER